MHVKFEQLCMGHFFMLQLIEKKSAQVRPRVLKEVEILYKCKDHPNILQLKDYFETDTHFYLVFEKMDGGVVCVCVCVRTHCVCVCLYLHPCVRACMHAWYVCMCMCACIVCVVCMCLCVCVHLCVHLCVCACMHAWCMCICVCACTMCVVCMCLCVYACGCMCMHCVGVWVCMHVDVHMCMHACGCVPVYLHLYLHAVKVPHTALHHEVASLSTA